MTRQSIRRRLDRLEKLNGMKDKPFIVIIQSLDDPTLYRVTGKPGDLWPGIDAPDYQTYANGKPGESMIKQDLIDKLENNYQVIVVEYTKQWREGNE